VYGEPIDGQIGGDTSTLGNEKESVTTSEVLPEHNINNNPDVSGATLSTEDILDLDDLNDANNISNVEESVVQELSTEPSSCPSEDKEEETTNVTSTDPTTNETSSNVTTTTVLEESGAKEESDGPPVQMGPFIDLLGETLLSLEMVDERRARLHEIYTNEALSGKTVVGLYFSADWCGPCRQFTPDLVNFYNRINSRKGREGQFEIVWISRCRDYESYAQYFTQMNWLAMQPEDAMGIRGQQLASRYKVKGIPSLVLLDEVGNVITLDARNKIPTDKAGIGFPWRNPIAQAYVNLVPKSVRLLIKTQFQEFKEQFFTKVKLIISTVQTARAANAAAK